jgi:hypothetical protein
MAFGKKFDKNKAKEREAQTAEPAVQAQEILPLHRCRRGTG